MTGTHAMAGFFRAKLSINPLSSIVRRTSARLS